jgi:uncharacterized membrane protein YfcA
MSYLVICSVALLASTLTFFSGFGLGTLLLPAFALFFAVERAVALTAMVHFVNGGFKLLLVGRHVERRTAVRFGAPAIVGGFAGAYALGWLAEAPALHAYAALGRIFEITPVKLTVGLLLAAFAVAELLPRLRDASFDSRYQPLGGLLSGFFGGLAGMQGALRTAFLVRSGLSKEAFVATGAAIAFLIDLSRIAVYWKFLPDRDSAEVPLLAAAVAAALGGALVGNALLRKVTMHGIQRTVAILLLGVSLGLVSGVL